MVKFLKTSLAKRMPELMLIETFTVIEILLILSQDVRMVTIFVIKLSVDFSVSR